MSAEPKEAEATANSSEENSADSLVNDDVTIEASPTTDDKSPEELIEALLADNASLKDERDSAKDQMLRIAAEMENLRRRTEKEVLDSRSYAITNFARDLLSIGDNLDRALGAVPDEAALEADAETVKSALAGLLEGVDMTGRELVRVLAKHNVTKEEPEGDRFDPNRHQAMFEVPNPEVPNGTVVQVVQAGYLLGDRVLRPAMVGVAKGGPKPIKTSET